MNIRAILAALLVITAALPAGQPPLRHRHRRIDTDDPVPNGRRRERDGREQHDGQ